jgi:hypothetical protein
VDLPAPWAWLYCRQSQLPAGDTVRTKTALAVELLRQADAESSAPILAVFDSAYAVETVVTPCLAPKAGRRRIELVTWMRTDARLYHPVVVKPQANGRPPKWGRDWPPPSTISTGPWAGRPAGYGCMAASGASNTNSSDVVGL